ncbi:Raslike GTP-binding protein YPT1 [Oopsacas minuta]|uniref:Raslike GTP-binding protein YPT1 n=1 Tax=Oopsacas minuta TaxID=111878 RepID=A0AAV7JR40_9METZ|nr:Raslike GTP-binding protein YPT1 [Oopsacas minuta]
MSIPEIKVTLLGDVGVGKTSLLHRFIKDDFLSDPSSSLTIDIGRKDIQCNSKKVCFVFQDTKGFESIGSYIPTSLFRSAECVIFVYDLSDLDSLETLQSWKKKLDNFVETYVSILVGNKLDLIGERFKGDLLDRAIRTTNSKQSFQVSAKSGVGCEDILQFLVETFHKRGCDTLTQSVNLNIPNTTQPIKVCCSLS